jgi:hypothetical protein
MSSQSAADVLREVVRRGHSVRLDAASLVVRPPIGDRSLRERVVARKLDIVALLREFGPPIHEFAALTTADEQAIKDLGVCIACGVPWAMHGMPAVDDWLRVEDPNSVVLQAQAIVACAAAAGEGSGA